MRRNFASGSFIAAAPSVESHVIRTIPLEDRCGKDLLLQIFEFAECTPFRLAWISLLPAAVRRDRAPMTVPIPPAHDERSPKETIAILTNATPPFPKSVSTKYHPCVSVWFEFIVSSCRHSVERKTESVHPCTPHPWLALTIQCRWGFS